MGKTFIPVNVAVFTNMKLSVITISNEIKKAYLYPDHCVRKLQDGIDLSPEDWINIKLSGEMEYSAQRWNRVLQTWKELNKNVLYKHFKYNNMPLKEAIVYMWKLYTNCDANRQKVYLEFRDALDDYTQKLIAGIGKHNKTVKQKAVDDLWAINFQKSEDTKYSELDNNRAKYRRFNDDTKEAWLTLAADYGLIPQTHTFHSRQWAIIRDAGLMDEPLSLSDPHQYKEYNKVEASDPIIEVRARYKKEFISESEKDLVLEAVRWFKANGDTNWLETTQLADGRVFSNRTLRLFGIPEESCESEEDITPETKFYQGDECDHYTMECRDFLEPLYEDVDEDLDNNMQHIIEDDVVEDNQDEDVIWDDEDDSDDIDE